jgi:hypothetical protein
MTDIHGWNKKVQFFSWQMNREGRPNRNECVNTEWNRRKSPEKTLNFPVGAA